MRLLDRSSTLVMITGGAGGHQVIPYMLPTQAAWCHMVQGQLTACFTAVLAGVMITAENFSAVQFDDGTWAFDHPVQADDRWLGEDLHGGVDITAPVDHHGGFTGDDQPECTAGGTHMDRCKIRI